MKGRLTLWAAAVLLTIAVVGWSLRYMDPFPPRRIVLATGQPDGAYDTFGREYASPRWPAVASRSAPPAAAPRR